MSLDQKLQVWNVIGTWLSSIGTVGAVCVALYLARRAERVRLQVDVGVRDIVMGDGTPIQKHVGFFVTNLGDRPVKIDSIGWRVGKGRKLRQAIQPCYGPLSNQFPITLSHGERANFLIPIALMDWPRQFATGFVEDLSDKHLKTLQGVVHTSVNQAIRVRPEQGLLDLLKQNGA